MKKLITILTLFMLCACTNEVKDVDSKDNNIINELSPKFIYETGICLKDNTLVEYSSLNCDTQIHIVDEDDTYYYFDNNNLILAIDKRYVRRSDEEAFVEYTGYTRNGSKLYSDLDLSEDIKKFALNNEVKVIDEFAGVLYVQYEDIFGYMSRSQVSSKKISTYVAPKPSTQNNNNDTTPDYSGGGSSSGSDSSSPTPTEPSPAPSSGDGEDITLSYYGDGHIVLLSDSGIDGKVLADNIKTYITKLNRGDIVKILNSDEEYCEILIDGRCGKIKKTYIRLDSEKAYEAWDGYTKSNIRIYNDSGLIRRCKLNEILHIVDEIDGKYVVELEDDSFAYVDTDDVSKTENKVYVAPKPSTQNNNNDTTPDYSGGGSSNSGSDSSTPTPSEPTPEVEWTPEVL
jgi:hypothetical protein